MTIFFLMDEFNEEFFECMDVLEAIIFLEVEEIHKVLDTYGN